MLVVYNVYNHMGVDTAPPAIRVCVMLMYDCLCVCVRVAERIVLKNHTLPENQESSDQFITKIEQNTTTLHPNTLSLKSINSAKQLGEEEESKSKDNETPRFIATSVSSGTPVLIHTHYYIRIHYYIQYYIFTSLHHYHTRNDRDTPECFNLHRY